MAVLHLPQIDAADHPRLSSAVHAFWAVCATIVLGFIMLAALGAVEPSEDVELTIVVLALAVLWLAHAWRELFLDERR